MVAGSTPGRDYVRAMKLTTADVIEVAEATMADYRVPGTDTENLAPVFLCRFPGINGEDDTRKFDPKEFHKLNSFQRETITVSCFGVVFHFGTTQPASRFHGGDPETMKRAEMGTKVLLSRGRPRFDGRRARPYIVATGFVVLAALGASAIMMAGPTLLNISGTIIVTGLAIASFLQAHIKETHSSSLPSLPHQLAFAQADVAATVHSP